MADGRTGGVWWLGGGAEGDGAEGGAGVGRGGEQTAVPVDQPSPAEPDSVYRPEPEQPTLVFGIVDRPDEASEPRTGLGGRSSGAAGGPGVSDVSRIFPGWDSAYFEFPVEEAEVAVPAQAAPAEPVAAEAAPAEAAGDAPAAAVVGALVGRRPSALLLIAALALIAGAVTGQFLAILGGWGAAYLSRQLSDLMKKFVVFGVPLLTMTGSAVWYWGRANGRWGSPLDHGGPLGQVTWSAAPGVLRVAAALSALVVLAITLRRRAE